MISRTVPFNERLNQIMAEKGVRAVDLAKAIGVSEGTISQYRSGYTEPKRDRLAAIAEYFHVSPTYLMGLSADQEMILDKRGKDSDFVADEQTLNRLMAYAEGFSRLTKNNQKVVNDLIESLYKAQGGGSDEG